MGSDAVHDGQLHRRIGLKSVLFQSIAFMAPGGSVVFGLGLIILYAKVAAPLALAVALIAALCVAACIGQLARSIPSAGGFFSYITAAMGKAAGFAAGWGWAVMAFVGPTIGALLFGIVGNDFCNTYLSTDVPWWLLSGAVMIATAAATLVGVKLSTGVTIVLGILEVSILLIVMIALIIHAGGDNTIQVLNFNKANSFGDFALGIVYAVAVFVGFEAAAPLAEEVKDPRRNIPLAVIGSTALIGIFYVLAIYTAVVGWGPGKLDGYLNSPDPWREMANQLGGWVAFFVIVAILNSLFAVTQAGFNASTRLLFAMGRARVLPQGLAKVHSKYETPWVAIAVVFVLSGTTSIGFGLWKGAFNAFIFYITIVSLTFIVLYIVTCIATPLFFGRVGRREFSWLWHGLVPLVGGGTLVVVLYKSVHPMPAYPASWAVWATFAWLAAGVVIAAALELSGKLPADELARAMDLQAREDEDPPPPPPPPPGLNSLRARTSCASAARSRRR
jgi:amino acid transporter